MAVDLMTEEIARKEFPGIPLAVLRQNLIKIMKYYGVTDQTTYKLADEMSPYFYLLDEKTGELSEEGRKKMEYWKPYLGDYHKETSFNNVMIGD